MKTEKKAKTEKKENIETRRRKRGTNRPKQY